MGECESIIDPGREAASERLVAAINTHLEDHGIWMVSRADIKKPQYAWLVASPRDDCAEIIIRAEGVSFRQKKYFLFGGACALLSHPPNDMEMFWSILNFESRDAAEHLLCALRSPQHFGMLETLLRLDYSQASREETVPLFMSSLNLHKPPAVLLANIVANLRRPPFLRLKGIAVQLLSESGRMYHQSLTAEQDERRS